MHATYTRTLRRCSWRSIPLFLLAFVAALLIGCARSDDPPPAAAAPAAPLILQQPADQSTTIGGTATFSVTASASGAPLAIQWQTLNGNLWSDIPGATASTFSISGATPIQSGTQYRAVVSASGQTLISTPVTLMVTPAPVPPAITVQPGNQVVTEPASATFSVTGTGSGTLGYQWQRNSAGGWLDISGANAASYTTPATVRANDNGAQFRVVIGNGAGTTASDVVSLTVDPLPVAPVFTTQPASVSVAEPATASFTVAVTGTPTPTLQWQVSTDGGTTWANVTTGSGATSTTYTTPATAVGMSGWRYRAVATSSAGSVNSAVAVLTVNATAAAPTLTLQPVNASVSSRTSAAFTVVATGTPTPTYQWQRQAPGGGGFLNITGATGASYSTPPVYFLDDDGASDAGAQYRVVVTNGSGSVTSNAATLTVAPAPLTGFSQISAGQNHVVALNSDGTVWSWGNNGYGQVGRSCTECSPRPVSALSGTFTQVLARGDTSFALRSDGTVWAWGYNGNGQLGRNLAAGTNSATPAQVVRGSDLQPLTGIVGVTMTNAGGFGGDAQVLAWTAAGVTWKWGHAASEPGLGGYPTNNFIAAMPHAYFDGSSAARSIARARAGRTATFTAIDGSGTVVFWTFNFAGASFGTTPVTPFSSIGFSGTAIDIDIDGDRVAIVRSDNTLWGQAYVDNGSAILWNGLNLPLVQLAVGEPVIRAAVGRFGSVTFAVGMSGTLHAAGDNMSAQLGGGTIGGRRTNFAPVLTINNAGQPTLGGSHAMSLRAGGAIWGWGDNAQRVNGTTDSADRRVGSPGWVQTEATPFAMRGR